jgi:hypothetical protein
MKNFTLSCVLLLFFSLGVFAQQTVQPVVNGGRWNNPSTWSSGSVPGNGDVVNIPAGMTVNVKNEMYSAATACPSNPSLSPTMVVNVFGSIAFEPSGRLNLGCGSIFFVAAGARIFSTTKNCSLRIVIGVNEVWGCNGALTTDEIPGPATINNGGILPGPLPVVMDLFRAKRQNNIVRMEWSTIQEISSKHFVVERSSDAVNWSSLSTLQAAGTSNTRLVYTYNDVNPLSGTAYYRIRQMDEDGKITFSGIARVGSSSTGHMFVYPNPVLSTANIVLSDDIRTNQSVQVFNMTGALVRKVAVKNGNLVQFNAESLAPGLYLIKVVEDGKVIEQTSFIRQ